MQKSASATHDGPPVKLIHLHMIHMHIHLKVCICTYYTLYMKTYIYIYIYKHINIHPVYACVAKTFSICPCSAWIQVAKKEVFGHEVGNLKVVRLLDLLKVCGLGPRSLIEMFDRTHGWKMGN